MLRCPRCWTYTFSEICPNCGAETADPAPPDFNPRAPADPGRRG